MRSPVHPVKYVCAEPAAQLATPARTKAATISVSRWRSAPRMPLSTASFAR
jgi:hypothetical protein